MHRVWVSPGELVGAAGSVVAIVGEEAEHALRVKRVRPGEAVELLDGAGQVGFGVVAESDSASGVSGKSRREHRDHRELRVHVQRVRVEPEPMVKLEVFTATPKGGHASEMIDQLSQLGAWVWGPLQTERGVVDPRAAKLERFERIARESAKQCGRTWGMSVRTPASLEQALARESATITVIADQHGAAWTDELRSGASRVRVLVGPEGGFTDREMDQAVRAGAVRASFGGHVLRIETAAVAAASIILHSARAQKPAAHPSV